MLSRQFTPLSLVAVLATGLAFGACEVEDETVVRGPQQNLTSVSPACETCLVALVECTTTSTTEAEFVQCRDVFGACQVQGQLGPDECTNPTDEQACILCEERLHKCEGDLCETQFTVCRALLTKNPDRCGGTAPQTPAAQKCQICLDGLGACAASLAEGGDSLTCVTGFEGCRSTNGITAEECPLPEGGRACELCDDYHDSCTQSGDSGCDAGHESCATALAGESGCGNDGAGGGGGGGTGPDPNECAHNECGEGEALDPSCSQCATDVCAEDAYCCEFAYDEACLDVAKTFPSCGCDAGCSHAECATGEALDATCSPCAAAVCDSDDFCCNNEWDDLCISIAVGMDECTCI